MTPKAIRVDSLAEREDPTTHLPNRIITDLGSPFTAIQFRSWAQDCGISIDYASLTHPQANNQVERANELLLAGLKPRLFDELKDYGDK